MATLRLASSSEGIRVIARSCANSTLLEVLRVARDVLDSLAVPTAIWHAEGGAWQADGPMADIPDPFAAHEWNVVPVVVQGQEIVAVLMTPNRDVPSFDLLATIGELVSSAAQRRDVERRAQDLATRLAEFQRLSQIGSFEWHIPTGRLEWSEQMHRVHGRVPGTWSPTYTGWLDHTQDDDRRHVADRHLEAFGQGGAFATTARIVRADDGAVRTIRTRGEIVADDLGRPLRMIGVCEDVTDLHELQYRATMAFHSLSEAAAREEFAG